MNADHYTAPRDCPVCSELLHVTRLGCPQCGTAISGQFRACEFCGMSEDDRELLRVFLTSRGTMREVERHLGVSHPTARARFDEMLLRLGYVPAGTARPEPESEPEPETAPEPDTGPDPRLATLRALAAGTMDVGSARERLGR